MRLTVKEFAAIVRVHPSTIYKMIRRGEIKAEKVDGKLHISEAELQRWEDSCEVPAKPNVQKQTPPPEYFKNKIITTSNDEIQRQLAWNALRLDSFKNRFDDFYKRFRKLEQNAGLLRRLWRWLW